VARADSLDSTTASVGDAHALLIQRIITNKPHPIHSWHVADASDFEECATHPQRMLKAVEGYVHSVMVDMKRSADTFVDADVGGCISDMRGDFVGQLRNCADDLRNGMGRAA
jgi:hypothetical protein